MSPHPLPPLSQSSADFESDSEYLGTPVDTPASRPPYVADYELPGEYYQPSPVHDSPEYLPGHQPAPCGQALADTPYTAAPLQHSLLLETSYNALPGACNQPVDGAIISSRWAATSQHPAGSGESILSSPYRPRSTRAASGDVHISSLAQSRRKDAALAQYPVQQPEWEKGEADCVESAVYRPTYLTTDLRHTHLSHSTAIPYPSSQSLASHPADFASHANHSPRSLYEDGCADSPVDDPAYGDRFPDQGSAYELQLAYGSYPPYPQPLPDAHFVPHMHYGSHFPQADGCTYPYSYLDHDPGYGHSSGHFSHIHAPRPQQIHDIHGLHSNTCPSDDAGAMRRGSHHILSIPSVPAPPPIPRPSSLIEDSPKKPLTLACYFCRKRKIACQSPPANAVDRTCNQCAKRKLKCIYPATSRRGIRPRMYDLTDDSFRRPSDSVAL